MFARFKSIKKSSVIRKFLLELPRAFVADKNDIFGMFAQLSASASSSNRGQQQQTANYRKHRFNQLSKEGASRVGTST
jgi:hypothetical protein